MSFSWQTRRCKARFGEHAAPSFVDFRGKLSYLKFMLKSSSLAAALLLLSSVAVGAQTSTSVTVDQISRPRPSASAIPQPVSSGSRSVGSADLVQRAEAAAGPSQEEIDVCRAASVQGVQLKGLDCASILEQAAARQARPSGEGVLLGVLGQRATLTTQEETRSGGTVDADSVARQLSTGGVQGNAAEVVATIRNNPPPGSPPR